MYVYLIGAGPGDPGLLTCKGKQILSEADVVIYDYLSNNELLSLIKPAAERIYVGKIAGNHAMSQEEINALLVRKAKEGKIVARLKGGDPYIFGRGGEEAEELINAGIPFEEIPGVTSAIAAPSYAGIPLTHRAYSSSLTIITGHEDPTKKNSSHDWNALARSSSTLVILMGMKNLPEISKKLITAGMPENMPAALVHWGTTDKQRSLVSTIRELPEAAIREGFTNPSIIVVGNVVQLHDKFNWFEKKPLFGKTIVVTRAREQASDTAGLFEKLGARVIQFPTIKIIPLSDYSDFDQELSSLSKYDWIIFTSVNGVRFFKDRLYQKGLDARTLGGVKIAAIGPATADAVSSMGIRADFIPTSYVAEGIAEGLCKKGLNGLKILIPRAKVAREILPETLRENGAEVTVLPAYETVPCEENKELVLQAMDEQRLDCITFGSSSTVKNFFSAIPPELFQKYHGIKTAVIGPVTAKTLRSFGVEPDIVPSAYTIPELVDAVAKNLSTKEEI